MFDPSEESYGAALPARRRHRGKRRPRPLFAPPPKTKRQKARQKRRDAKLVAKASGAKHLGKRIARVKARIALTKKAIRQVKAQIGVSAGLAVTGIGTLPAAVVGTASAARLHELETALHRDRHLLKVLQQAERTKKPADVAVAEHAEEVAAAGGDPAAVVTDYPAPTTPAPEQKAVETIVAEAQAEAEDPAAAEAHDEEAAGTPPAAGETPASEEPDADEDLEDHAVALKVDRKVEARPPAPPIYKRPLFWVSVVLGTVAFTQRDTIAAMVRRGAA